MPAHACPIPSAWRRAAVRNHLGLISTVVLVLLVAACGAVPPERPAATGTSSATASAPATAPARQPPAATSGGSASGRTPASTAPPAGSGPNPAAAPGAVADRGWPSYGNGPWSEHFAVAPQLTPATAKDLRPAFSYVLGSRGVAQEGTPIEAGGVLYAVATGDVVTAMDAATGHVLWRFDPAPLRPPAWASPISRGLALDARHVYLVTADDRLIAIDRSTGRPAYTVRVADPAQGYGETGAPLVAQGEVFVGSAGGDEGVRGFVAAYRASDGTLLWRRYTVPQRGHGWLSAGGYHGGGAVWSAPAFDPASGLLYAGTGNPSPDYFGAGRPGPDPYTDSLLALNGASGALRWAAQEVPHDLWDYDLASPPLLFRAGGRTLVGEAGKDGLWYEWDARSGRPATRPVAFVKERHSPPTASGTLEWPGPDGGANYGPTSYDPALHLAFVAGIDGPARVYGRAVAHRAAGAVDDGSGTAPVPGVAWTGTFTAIDVRTGRIAWQLKTASPPIGGSCAVSGGVVVFGQEDGRLDAVAARTGRVVWRVNLGVPVGAAPLVYTLHGSTFVAAATGGAQSLVYQFPSRAAGRLEVFRLG